MIFLFFCVCYVHLLVGAFVCLFVCYYCAVNAFACVCARRCKSLTQSIGVSLCICVCADFVLQSGLTTDPTVKKNLAISREHTARKYARIFPQ